MDVHNYFCANSINQKKVNWNTLNRKVLGKLGMKLSDGTIQYLVDAKAGAVEQVLWDIRRRIQDMIGRNYDQEELLQEPEHQLQKTYSGRSVSSTKANYYSKTQMVPDLIEVQLDEPKIPVRGSPSNKVVNPSAAALPIRTSYRKGQGYIASPEMRTQSIENNNGHQSQSQLYPTQITYRGQKMVPLSLLEDKLGEINGLEVANKALQTKVKSNFFEIVCFLLIMNFNDFRLFGLKILSKLKINE